MPSVVTNLPEALHLHGIVVPGTHAQDLFIVDGKFTFQPQAHYRTILRDGYFIPGLVDTHAHLAIASPAPQSATPEQRVRASAQAHLDAGVLAVREPGSPNYASHGIGPHEGLPHIVTAGRFLAPPGRYFPGLAHEVTDTQMPAAAEAEARASGAWAKIIGDWIGGDGRMHTNYRRETMAEAARRVHALGARIAVHATTAETIESAIEAGFDSIEHGLGLADDHIAAMLANDRSAPPMHRAMHRSRTSRPLRRTACSPPGPHRRAAPGCVFLQQARASRPWLRAFRG